MKSWVLSILSNVKLHVISRSIGILHIICYISYTFQWMLFLMCYYINRIWYGFHYMLNISVVSHILNMIYYIAYMHIAYTKFHTSYIYIKWDVILRCIVYMYIYIYSYLSYHTFYILLQYIALVIIIILVLYLNIIHI